MPIPFLRQFFPLIPKDGQAERFLDNQYQLELVAQDDRQLIDYLTFAFQMRRDAAVAQLRGMVDYASPAGRDDLSALLPVLTSGAAGTPAGAAFQPVDVVRQHIEAQAKGMLERQARLEEIFLERRAAQESAGNVEVLDEGYRALKNGMISTGRDQEEEFKDALQLLRQTQDGAIGSRNYVTWFQIGWLLWKLERNLPEAEEAFYQAFRLSSAQGDLYHVYALRHRAYLQSLQNKHEDALLSAARAVRLAPDDHATLFDAARCAARAGREDEAMERLSRCLELEPGDSVTAFAEADLTPVIAPLADLVLTKCAQGRRGAAEAVARMRAALAASSETEARAGVSLSLPEGAVRSADEAEALLARDKDGLGYVTALGIVRAADARTAAIFDAATAGMEKVLADADAALQRPRRHVDKLHSDKKQWEGMLYALEKEAKHVGFKIDVPPRKPSKLSKLNFLRRPNPRIEGARINYATCKVNLAQTEASLRDELPRLEAAIAAGEAQRAKLADALDYLRGQRRGSGGGGQQGA